MRIKSEHTLSRRRFLISAATAGGAAVTLAALGAPIAAAAPHQAPVFAQGATTELTLGLVSEWDMVGWDKLLNEQWYQQHPEIKIKYFLQPPQTWQQTLQTQFSGGAGPDVFFIWGNVNQDWWNNGLKYSMNIGDQLNSDPQGWGVRDDIRTSLQGHDGSDFQIAMRLETVGIWYNKNLFAQLGITPPAQSPDIQAIPWDQFTDWCERAKAAGLIPVSLSAPWRLFLHPTILEIERTYPKWDALYDSKSQLRYADQPEVREGWQAFLDFYNAGYLPDGFFGLGVEQQRALWVQQRAPMTLDGHWMWRDFGQRTKEAGFEYGVLPMPSATPDAPFPYAPPALDCFAVSRATKVPDQSVTFLKFLASPPIQTWMTDNWRNISISPGITYTEPETGMFAKTLEKNLLFKSLSSAFGNEVGTTFDAQFEPLANGSITIDDALAEIQNKIDVSPLRTA
jgi:raffinose/stachyose/melibiose transport system substrate-binding protein